VHEKMGSRKAHKSWRNPLRTGNKLVYWDVLPKAARTGFPFRLRGLAARPTPSRRRSIGESISNAQTPIPKGVGGTGANAMVPHAKR